MFLRPFHQWSVQARLVSLILGISLLTMLVIGWAGWNSGRRALTDAAFEQVAAERIAKEEQIERFFDEISGLAVALATDHMVIEATTSFANAYDGLRTWPIVPEWEDRVDQYYESEFLPRLAEGVVGEPLLSLYQPSSTPSIYLQYHYMAANPFPPEQKHRLVLAEEDSSPYAPLHASLHPAFQTFVEQMALPDLLLVSFETGDVVYSVAKRTEYATNLFGGPYRESSLAHLFRSIQSAPEKGAVRFEDFRPYRPAHATPTAFLGTPVFDGTQAVGVLILGFPIESLNTLLSSGDRWTVTGLGDTGQTYLVGNDLLMRSDARGIRENMDEFVVEAVASGVDVEALDRIQHFGTSVLLHPVQTLGVEEALDGDSATFVQRGLLGREVLASVGPLTLPGLQWVLVSEVTTAEAFQPVTSLQRSLLITSVILTMVVTMMAVALARLFVQPIRALIQGVRRVNEGELDVVIARQSDDEFGALTNAFNQMLDNIRRQTSRLAEQNSENERLLRTILPGPIADRMQSGERVVDDLQQVSVLYMRMLGFAEMAHRSGARRSAAALEELITALDDAAAQVDVERVKTIGETYVAACGLTSVRLDHTKRLMDFAIAALEIVQQFDLHHHESLALQIGIHTGPVVAGVVGSDRFVFELWGETVNVAHDIHLRAEPNAILATQDVYDHVHNFYPMSRHAPVEVGERLIDVWQYPADSDENE